MPPPRPSGAIRDEKGAVVATDTLPPRDIPTGKLTPLGQIEASLAKAAAPGKLTVSLSLKGTPDRERMGNLGLSAEGESRAAQGADGQQGLERRSETNLGHRAAGCCCLPRANNSQSLPGRFLPVFWSPVWFPTQKPNTMGILCDPKHPALAEFPTEFYSNWQWCELLDHSRSIILDDTPAEFRPIVQVIDNFARNHKMGVIFEARVGAGRLLVCGIDLPGLVEKQPAARQLLASLQRYAGSEAFHPAVGTVGRDAGQTLLAGRSAG